MFNTKDTFNSKYEIKKSVFISYLTTYNNFKPLLKKLKEEHPKATHIVWAYRTLNEFDQIVENSTDDGEPKGCAGNPTMSVLRGEDIIESAIITVRYFGGTKLGVGGMIRAYSSSAKEVISQSILHKFEKKFPIEFNTSYNKVNRYEHFFKQQNINFQDREFGATEVKWKLLLTNKERENFDNFEKNL